MGGGTSSAQNTFPTFVDRRQPIKLLQALQILRQPISETAGTQDVFLACGFTPLHFRTFLEAYLRLCFPAERVEVKTGLYGDLLGNLERLDAARFSLACVLVEWSDLDPRLGIRSHGSWRRENIADAVKSARKRSERLIELVGLLAKSLPTYVSPPTLPLPPVFVTRGSQAHPQECELREIAASLATSFSKCHRARVINAQWLDEMSPFARRFDPKAEISTGFPYSLEHASRVSQLLATLIRNAAPKKGIITDLDDTLWAGILGEIGVEGICWDTSRQGHLHGLYQRFLDSLTLAGTLIAIASKNDPELAEKALRRDDLLVQRDRVFPLEINWGPKSVSVDRILRQWNVMPSDVVFIDDSPREVAEVQASFPEMECIVFPKSDPLALWELFKRLRDSFGKSTVTAEDEIRIDTIRTAATLGRAIQGSRNAGDEFLRTAEATISFLRESEWCNGRAFELVNKTNQFNLNGRRVTESEWLAFLRDPAALVLSASYKDKYGTLGKIAVLAGRGAGSRLTVNLWVMSCRAFSRQIEHQYLKYLFEKMGFDEICFDCEQTQRNAPIQEFFREVLGKSFTPPLVVPKTWFAARAVPLFHRVVDPISSTEKTPQALQLSVAGRNVSAR
jgi:FkbH-like protein